MVNTHVSVHDMGSLTFVLVMWWRAGAVLQRRVRAAVLAVAGRQREEGGEAPEDRPVLEGDRRSWYAQLPFVSLRIY
jgi:hypothetical protein